MHDQISFNPSSATFTKVLGIGPNQTEIAVDDQWFRVRMGWAFRLAVRRSDISAAERVTEPKWWWGIGAHLIGSNRWIVNGTLSNLVEVRFTDSTRGTTLGLPTKVDSLIVSTRDPDVLIAALQN